MKGLILAAGYATRLGALTENFPKPLLRVGDRAIVDWLVDDLSGTLEGFTVVTNHKFASLFREWAEDRPEDIVVLDDGTTANEHRLGAVRDMALAVKSGALDGDTLVMAGDNLLDFSLRGFVDYAAGLDAPCVMCHPEHRPDALRRTAVITTDARGRVTSFQEKPAEPLGNLAVPPFYRYRAEDLARLDEALRDGCGADAPGSFAAWLSRRVPVYAYTMPGKRYDIGDRASYEYVQRLFAGSLPAERTDT